MKPFSTPRQIHLEQCLHYPKTEYLHLPLAVNASGEKWAFIMFDGKPFPDLIKENKIEAGCFKK